MSCWVELLLLPVDDEELDEVSIDAEPFLVWIIGVGQLAVSLGSKTSSNSSTSIVAVEGW